ncbi:protein ACCUMULATION AND REPLICATION OF CHLOROPLASTS 3, chloroplastic isoform X3 [Lotus japonicus]|uniref:protein ACCUMULATION AND REPLICATION OF CHLOROPLASTS 3, chloroplastic isoform X3 n=1 Tax=Lotus japonicus TaxID=34305 RepID=UPI002582AA44|nr:protein ACCUMULATION AND REPLICATION OF CHLOROPLASTS 3, chloroplastic isoform X3 [Lotus japonicus]
MELSAIPTFNAATSHASLFPFPSTQLRCSLLPRYHATFRNSKPFLQIRFCAAASSNGYGGSGVESGESDPDFVEVIVIGGRKDAVLDFCLNSPFQLSSLRFWNILMKESEEVQLQRWSIQEEPRPEIVKAPAFMKSCSKTIVLVASAGYGLDHTVAVDIFETVRSKNGLTVAIVLKPFSFEGLRRQDEVKALMGKLKDNTNLLIEIDIDALLKKDLLTLDEAMKTANDAVLLAIKAISVLRSGMHRKFIDKMHDDMKETSTSEINKILECYKEARIGFGAAYNIRTSIFQSIFDCPFLGVSLKDPNSIVICILTRSVPINDSDIAVFLHTFRQTTQYMGDIIISTVFEPDVEPNLLITTVLVLGSLNVQQPSQSGGLLSRLALHFPHVFSFWGKHNQQQMVTGKENAVCEEMMGSYDIDEGANKIAPSVMDDRFDKYYEELEPAVSNISSKLSASRDVEKDEEHLFDDTANYPALYDSSTEEESNQVALGDSAFPREQLENWSLGPGFEVAREWAQERAADAPMVDNISIFHLPVGVRHSEELKDCLEISVMTKKLESETDNDMKVPTLNGGTSSWSSVTDAGVGAVREFASSLLKGKYANKSKKDGVLSVRAASMLESERDLSKKWSPVVEMQYRGGRYKGRCQGGLPEGKTEVYMMVFGAMVRDQASVLSISKTEICFKDHGGMMSCTARVGFIFTPVIGGLRTFGKERLMVKGGSTQSLVMPTLGISKMDGGMASFFVLMLMGQGTLKFGNMVFF